MENPSKKEPSDLAQRQDEEGSSDPLVALNFGPAILRSLGTMGTLAAVFSKTKNAGKRGKNVVKTWGNLRKTWKNMEKTWGSKGKTLGNIGKPLDNRG